MSTATEVQYDPNGLLNAVKIEHNLKNDAALSRFLGVKPPVISKMRHHVLPVGDSFILRCHEVAGMPVAAVRKFIGGGV